MDALGAKDDEEDMKVDTEVKGLLTLESERIEMLKWIRTKLCGQKLELEVIYMYMIMKKLIKNIKRYFVTKIN